MAEKKKKKEPPKNKPKAKRKVGSPTIYNTKLADKICEVVATSNLGTNKLCLIHKAWMPSQDTIYKWRYRHQKFAENYAKAKAQQAELLAEEIIDIADDGFNDTYIDDEGLVKTDSDVIQRSRLRVDTRKWYASKLAPKIYGDARRVENLESQNAELIAEMKELRQEIIEQNKKEY